jgi:histidinol phosphatase-like PHP family hydrolase
MANTVSRREILARAAGVLALPGAALPQADSARRRGGLDFPLVDYHVHLDEAVTLDQALELSRERGVKFGIVEHAGTKENKYRGLLSNDEELKRYLARLAGKPVYTGIQAEGLDWMTCFSRQLVVQLDYVLTDALTFPEKDGRRVELWRPAVEIPDPQDFMERYVEFHVQVMAREPIDILANPTFLPARIEKDYDALWTPGRMQRIIQAAAKYGVAIEINSRYRLPRLPFLKMARRAGVKFSFGSNIHGLEVGNLDYGVEMAGELGLTAKDIFTPAAPGRKPIERRRFA